MTDTPWFGDACSLVEAFRRGERSPVEELEASLAAIEASDLNAFSHLDPDRARDAAKQADVAKPFGGVPTAIKQLEPVEGWPLTEASLVFRDRIADHTGVNVRRLFEVGGVSPLGQTTSSEFGGLNVSTTKLNGITHNPWRHGRTVGGSSAGSSAAVAGGLVSLATGGDGGGSIRIPAGYTGLLGMKGTFGRIPRGPHAFTRPNTVVLGNLARSVRDAARFFDVCGGYHPSDPSSLPRHESFEEHLGTHDLAGLKVAVLPGLNGIPLEAGVEEHLLDEAEALVASTGMKRVELTLDLPNLAAYWMADNLITLLVELGDRWPACAGDMTDEIVLGMRISEAFYNLRSAAQAERYRVAAGDALAEAFAEVDLIVCATNPGPAFDATWQTSNPQPAAVNWITSQRAGQEALRALVASLRVASGAATSLPARILDAGTKRLPDLANMGGLTMPSNLYGNPAVSIPAGTVDGLPVGLQVLAPHHADALLLDVALSVERNRPWPLVAPGVAPAAA